MVKKGSLDPQEEIVRLLAIQVRRQSDNQGEAILELNKAGFGAARIAELLGTTPNTVNVAIQKAKKKSSKPKKVAAGGDASGDS
jgi:DNA-directed RNA polymerase specialized sigma24 family protein